MIYDLLKICGLILLVSLGFELFDALWFPWRAKRRPLKRINQNRNTVIKPWGREEIWAHTDHYVGKLLYIKAGHSLSRQYHKKKDETIIVISGVMHLEVAKFYETETIGSNLHPGDSYHIEPYTIHRMTAVEDVAVAEVSTPELEDVVRLEDNYGRK